MNDASSLSPAIFSYHANYCAGFSVGMRTSTNDNVRMTGGRWQVWRTSVGSGGIIYSDREGETQIRNSTLDL